MSSDVEDNNARTRGSFVRWFACKTFILLFFREVVPFLYILVLMNVSKAFSSDAVTKMHLPIQQRNPVSSYTSLPHHTWGGYDVGEARASLTHDNGV